MSELNWEIPTWPPNRASRRQRARAWLASAVSLFIASLFLAIGCDSDTTAPEPGSFRLEIVVLDSAGRGQPGLQVSARNKILGNPVPVSRPNRAIVKPPPSGFFLYPCYPNPFEGTTRLEIDLPALCDYRLTFLRLDGDTADLFLDDSADAGRYPLTWAPPDRIPGVYLCRFTAGSVDAPIFVDSSYLASWPPGPEPHTLGFTDAMGRVITTDSMGFPSLYALPDMVWTNELGPDTLGLFRFSDTLEILVTDTLLERTRPFERVLRSGPNTLEVTWTP